MQDGSVPSPFGFSFLKGGPGSGYHGHSGRPGERGGSSSSGGQAQARSSTERVVDAALDAGKAIAAKQHISDRLSKVSSTFEELMSHSATKPGSREKLLQAFEEVVGTAQSVREASSHYSSTHPNDLQSEFRARKAVGILDDLIEDRRILINSAESPSYHKVLYKIEQLVKILNAIPSK